MRETRFIDCYKYLDVNNNEESQFLKPGTSQNHWGISEEF